MRAGEMAEIEARIAAGVSERSACGDNKTRAAFRRWKESKTRATVTRGALPVVDRSKFEQNLASGWPGWSKLTELQKDILISGYASARECGESAHAAQAWKMFARALFPDFANKDNGKRQFTPDDYKKTMSEIFVTRRKFEQFLEKKIPNFSDLKTEFERGTDGNRNQNETTEKKMKKIG